MFAEEYDKGVTTTSDDGLAEIQKGMEKIKLGATVPDSSREIRQPTQGHMLVAMATTHGEFIKILFIVKAQVMMNIIRLFLSAAIDYTAIHPRGFKIL